jgi:hypothetical protein
VLLKSSVENANEGVIDINAIELGEKKAESENLILMKME